MAARPRRCWWLQWGHGDEAVEEARAGAKLVRNVRRFNGATAMKPWKRLDEGDHGIQFEPLQWGHGDEAVEEISASRKVIEPAPGFNGATAMKPWKRVAPMKLRSLAIELQWGHGDEAVEEFESKGNPFAGMAASMGPRR